MIKSFRHKGLERFFVAADARGLTSAHVPKLSRLLDAIDTIVTQRFVTRGVNDLAQRLCESQVNVSGSRLRRAAARDATKHRA